MEMNCNALSTTVLLGLARIYRDCIQAGSEVDTCVVRLDLVRKELKERPQDRIDLALTIEKQNLFSCYENCAIDIILSAAARQADQPQWLLTELERRHKEFIQETFQLLIMQKEKKMKAGEPILFLC
ncbi:hypothetical protein ACFL0Z_01385 [Patescibacteria group bacterium]